MSEAVLNRIMFALSCIGMFIAGTIAITHIKAVSLPCGGNSAACAAVQSHPSSYWFGIPVAYFGLGGYLLLALISGYRMYRGTEQTKSLTSVTWAMTGVGSLISIGLIAYSIMAIRATCDWCVASAITMCLMLLVNAFMAQSDVPGTRNPNLDATVLGVFVVATLGGLGYQYSELKQAKAQPIVSAETLAKLENSAMKDKLFVKDGNMYGDPNAPITLVEFADFECGMCRSASPVVKRIVDESNGKIRLIYRHFPLRDIHPQALMASYLSEIAAEKGKFWEFQKAVGNPDLVQFPTNEELVQQTMAETGLTQKEIDDRMADPEKDPAFQRVVRDSNLAGELGVRFTPTFFVFAEGTTPTAVGKNGLAEILSADVYKAILNAK